MMQHKGRIMSNATNERKGRKGKKGTNAKGDVSPARVDDPTFPRNEGEGDDAYNARVTRRNELCEKLRNVATRNDGKRVRRQLRALGHFGGLRHERAQGRANVVATNVVANAIPRIGTRDAC